MKSGVCAVGIRVEEAHDAELSEGDRDPALRKRGKKQERRTEAGDFLVAQRNDVVPRVEQYKALCSDLDSARCPPTMSSTLSVLTSNKGEEGRLSNEFSISSLHQDPGGWNQRI